MKRIILALLILPQLAYAQYRANVFNLEPSDNVSQMEIRETFSKDTTIIFNEKPIVSGLSISGIAILNNNNDSYIRVTLVDEYNYEFLVYENYPALSDELTSTFSNVALETVLLDDITPQYLKINLLNASLRLENISISTSSGIKKQNTKNSATIQKEQAQYIIDRLNINLEKKNMTWRAGMTSISELTYSEKKDMFGGFVPKLYGFEHYIGGVFVMPGEYLNTPKTESGDDKYVKEWDWRNRHGKNWMTPVKNQQTECKSCWAHVAIGLTESYVNLYYNETINYNLSEQELISCNSRGYGCSCGSITGGLSYIRDNGVVDEDCFPYTASEQDCQNKCSTPSERIFIERRTSHSFNEEDSIKQHLFKSPISFSPYLWGHVTILAGYKKAQHGDVVYNGLSTDHSQKIVIDSTSHADIIDKTIWLLKNSWGKYWGDNGYCYLIDDNTKLKSYVQIFGKITSQIYTDSDIICEDADGDGYYFWGIGPKPAHCPSWVPDIPDGDDSNINYGPMDDFGNLALLTPIGSTINSAVSYDTNEVLSNRIGVVKNGTLTITSNITMTNDAIIRVCENGKLIVDGGSIQNANLQLIPGGEVVLQNGGTINTANDCELNVPIGAVVTIKDGIIR